MQTAEAQFHDDYLALAKRLFTARAVDAAHRALKKALVCAPESTAGVSLLGNIRLANGGEKMALAAFHRAVLLDGYRDPQAWMNYGNALLVVDDGLRAVDAYRTVLRLDPEHVMATTQLAVWYLKADMGDLARPYVIDLMARPDMLPPRLWRWRTLCAFGAGVTHDFSMTRHLSDSHHLSRGLFWPGHGVAPARGADSGDHGFSQGLSSGPQ